jgi:hypothetical protein
MAGQLIPPPELAPTLPKGLTSEQRIALWVDLMNACGEFLQAGLRHRLGPNEDLLAAHRQWYDRQMEEHDRTVCHMLKELSRRERNQAR